MRKYLEDIAATARVNQAELRSMAIGIEQKRESFPDDLIFEAYSFYHELKLTCDTLKNLSDLAHKLIEKLPRV